jgi:broad specificity phosphatase PhoE
MQKIILIRHAKVDIDSSIKLNAKELHKWVSEYDKADIITNRPNLGLKNELKDIDYILTSEQKRTVLSAKLLSLHIDEKNELFNEVPLPTIDIPFLKMSAKSWLIFLRVLMILKIGDIDSSLKISKKRAKDASIYLSNLSKKHKKIALIGHGGKNYLIYKELLKMGWSLEGKASFKNLDHTTLIKA